jgi:hypothetical protein
MTRQRAKFGSALGLAAMLLLVAAPAPARAQWSSTSSQRSVSAADIQRLQDQVYQASSDVSRMRGGTTDLATRLQSDLDDLRDEVTYLKVKLRKEGAVSDREYTDVRDRLQDLRSRARGEDAGYRTGSSTSTGSGSSSGTWSSGSSRETSTTTRQGSNTIPAGQELDVRLQNELSSDTAEVEQRFEATTVADLYRGSDVLIPAGSLVRGIVSSVNKASRTDRKGSMTLAFDQITVRGRTYPMRATVVEAIESEGIKGEIGKIGTGGAVGAIIGGIIGGAKGALIGVLVGAGGTIAATEGKDVTLPSGTLLRVRLDQPPSVR